MKRLSLIITVPLLLLLAVFAVSNRQIVELNFWPFGIALTMPLFLLALGMLAVGALAGALWMWLPLTRWRLRARSCDRRIIELEAALAENRAIVAQLRGAPPPDPLLAAPHVP
jgi:putative membrane protein